MIVQRRRRPGETTFGLAFLLLALFFAWQSWEISGFSGLSTPGAFPMAVSAVMVVAALIVVAGNFRQPGEVEGLARSARAFFAHVAPPIVIVFTILALAYSVLLSPLGFLPASFLFLFAAIGYLHRGGLVFTFLISLLALIAIYAVFRLVFKVVLPEGIVPEREIIAWVGRLLSGAGAR